ncbi:zinc-dependent peptidase [Coralloluteibacterium thermophilus]|uniref:Zinc-dependent peptidase n=1 Tax=Coralloluteibacterium thermophilum TaxID=2707049 RepID=A0ABV9NHM3_9GAMM
MAQLPAGHDPLIPPARPRAAPSARMPLSFLRRLGARLASGRPPAPVADTDWDALLRTNPFVAALDAGRQARLRELAARFLADKAITPVDGFALDPLQRLTLASLCCLPVLECGYPQLAGWSQVVVYPAAFRVNRQQHDDATGVLTEWEDELAGEAWSDGPLILSWADIEGDLADPGGGFCVAVHEIAHKLDLRDGVLDGTPLLPRDWQRAWARDFQAAFDAFAARVDAGEETPLDPYAAEAPEEFFAVASEYHFSAPDLLAAEMPAVAAHLRRFYGDSPMAARPA